MANIYHPKGSMCAVCANNELPCAKVLQFQYMPPMKKYKQGDDNMIIVKCLMFIKLNKER